jgi:hypothetical protein
MEYALRGSETGCREHAAKGKGTDESTALCWVIDR